MVDVVDVVVAPAILRSVSGWEWHGRFMAMAGASPLLRQAQRVETKKRKALPVLAFFLGGQRALMWGRGFAPLRRRHLFVSIESRTFPGSRLLRGCGHPSHLLGR